MREEANNSCQVDPVSSQILTLYCRELGMAPLVTIKYRTNRVRFTVKIKSK